jgi:hypothetical protein
MGKLHVCATNVETEGHSDEMIVVLLGPDRTRDDEKLDGPLVRESTAGRDWAPPVIYGGAKWETPSCSRGELLEPQCQKTTNDRFTSFVESLYEGSVRDNSEHTSPLTPNILHSKCSETRTPTIAVAGSGRPNVQYLLA